MEIIKFKFGVVIPLYNKSSTIIKCLSSLSKQILLPSLVVIVDDGSTDDSLDLVHEFKNNNNILNIILISQENSGVSCARNCGIEIIYKHVDYISLLDADDFWHKNYLLLIQRAILEFPNHMLFSTGHKKIQDINGTRFKKDDVFHSYGIVKNYYKYAIKNSLINSSKLTFSSKLHKEVTFPVGISVGEDHFVWHNLTSNYELIYINLPLVNIYQKHEELRLERNIKVPYLITLILKNKIKLEGFYFTIFIYKILIFLFINSKINNNYFYQKKLLFISRCLSRSLNIFLFIASIIPVKFLRILSNAYKTK